MGHTRLLELPTAPQALACDTSYVQPLRTVRLPGIITELQACINKGCKRGQRWTLEASVAVIAADGEVSVIQETSAIGDSTAGTDIGDEGGKDVGANHH
jgi:hypothetical protein